SVLRRPPFSASHALSRRCLPYENSIRTAQDPQFHHFDRFARPPEASLCRFAFLVRYRTDSPSRLGGTDAGGPNTGSPARHYPWFSQSVGAGPEKTGVFRL